MILEMLLSYPPTTELTKFANWRISQLSADFPGSHGRAAVLQIFVSGDELLVYLARWESVCLPGTLQMHRGFREAEQKRPRPLHRMLLGEQSNLLPSIT
jgi:hypothetical protein